uniref:Putative secreted protein n=1 Tax=Anopheles darlingi TaxID=43151 RepID=A0A2M4DB35_ANODA
MIPLARGQLILLYHIRQLISQFLNVGRRYQYVPFAIVQRHRCRHVPQRILRRHIRPIPYPVLHRPIVVHLERLRLIDLPIVEQLEQ